MSEQDQGDILKLKLRISETLTPLVFTTDNTPCYPKNMFFLTQPFFQNMPDYSLANWATPVGVGHSIVTSLRLTVICSCGPTACAVAVASVLVVQAFHNRTWVPAAKDPNTDNPTPHPGVPVTFVKLAGSFLIWQSWQVCEVFCPILRIYSKSQVFTTVGWAKIKVHKVHNHTLIINTGWEKCVYFCFI